jgi:hypothetical protein
VDQTNILRTVASLKMLRDGPPRIVHWTGIFTRI